MNRIDTPAMDLPSAADPLVRLGDEIERATARGLMARRRRLRVVAAGVATLSIAVAGTAAAAAAGLFTPREIAAGMPAGTAIFGETDPTCALDADGITYHCTLSRLPAPESLDHRGSKELIAIDGRIAGGCIGQDEAGLTWDCFVGEEAVRREILVEDLLGQPMLAPGNG